jgi:hypothetical protein
MVISCLAFASSCLGRRETSLADEAQAVLIVIKPQICLDLTSFCRVESRIMGVSIWRQFAVKHAGAPIDADQSQGRAMLLPI